MIKLENVEIVGWRPSIRGMRNPLNSHHRMDSYATYIEDPETLQTAEFEYFVGENDHNLMMTLAKGGPVHAKYRRMIMVYVDITAPLYWWKEADTYKVGTVANSCSTMHKIHDKEIILEDFSCEHLVGPSKLHLTHTIECMNLYRDLYINGDELDPACENPTTRLEVYNMTKKDAWWQMIQLLPSSYNQKRTVMLSYETLANIYEYRRFHKLDEWREVCKWIESLPYSEIITKPIVEKAKKVDVEDVIKMIEGLKAENPYLEDFDTQSEGFVYDHVLTMLTDLIKNKYEKEK